MSKLIYLEGEGFKPYNIVIENDYSKLIDGLKAIKASDKKVCIISDSNVAPLHGNDLLHKLIEYFESVSLYVIEAGEENKNLDTVSDIYANLISLNFNRGDMLIALGGGVVGDITGFAAATYMRGIDFIQVPTTLLSQVDSSVGGKTGVDYNSYKNMVGAFYQPRLVYINTSLLRTLPGEQISAGIGEIIKYGLIKDKEFFKWLNDNTDKVLALDEEAIEHIIFTSCSIKQQVVSEDPTEQGLRAILNFGHTLGHAIEKLKNFTLLHGECVAIGMVAAGYISFKRGYISENDLSAIVNSVKSYKLPVKYDGISENEIILAAKHDKKSTGKSVKFILINGVGNAVIDSTVTDEEMCQALRYTEEL